jgi:plasmid stabilization system protein ParE
VVIWSRPARADLRSIHDFIAHDSRFYAKKVVQDIREKTDILKQLPKTGKKVPELNKDEIRELPLYSYRIIYEIKEQGIFVLAVVHKRRDLKAENIDQI